MASSPSPKGNASSKNVSKTGPVAKNSSATPKSRAASNAASKAANQAFRSAAPVHAATDGMTGVDKIVWICLHLLVFLVPIAMSNYSWIENFVKGQSVLPLTYDQFDIVKVFVMRAAAFGGLAAWAFQFFFQGGKLRRTKLDWLIVGFLSWVLLTSFLSISPATALFGKYRRFEGFFSFLTYAIVYFLVVQLADRQSRIRSIARTLLFSGLLVAGYGVLQSLGADPLRWGALPFEVNRAFSTFGNPDLLGGFLIFPLVIAVGMALSEANPWWRGFYWFTFLISVWCWIVAAVRGAWIGGAVGLVIIVIAAVLAHARLNKVDWSFIGLTGLAGTALVVKSMSNANSVLNVVERLGSIFKFGEGSALTRFEIWQAAIDAVKARPIFGFGADTFRLVFPLYKPQAYVKDAGYLSVADNVHNYPLQLMAGIGIVGFVLLYGLFGWALWLGAPDAFARGKGTDRLVIAGFWAAAVGYIVHLMTGLSVTGSTVFLWMSLAIIVAPTARETEHKAPSWGPIVGTLLIAVMAAGWIGNFMITYADNLFLGGQFSQNNDRLALNQQAIALNPYNDIYRSMLGKSYEGQLDYWIDKTNSDLASGADPSQSKGQLLRNFQDAERTYQETIVLVPTEYDNYLFLSALYMKVAPYLGDTYYDKAIAAADAGIAVEPFGPGVRLQKASALAAKNDLPGALAAIMDPAAWDPAYVDPQLLTGQLLTNSAKYAEAEVWFRKVSGVPTSDPMYVNVHLFYAQMLSLTQRYAEVDEQLALLKDVGAGDPRYVAIHQLHAEALAKLGRYGEAADEFRLALQYDSGSGSATAALKAKPELYKIKKTDPRYVDVHAFYVQVLASLQRYPEAVDEMQVLLEIKPTDANYVSVRLLYAQLLTSMKSYAKAVDQFQLALKRDKTTTSSQAALAAKDEILKIAASDPKYVAVHLFYAQLLAESSSFADAETQLGLILKVKRSDANYVKVHLLYAQVLASQQRFTEAEAQVAGLLDIGRGNADYVAVRLLHAQMLASLQKYTQAEAQVALILNVKASHPDYVNIHVLHAQLLSILKDYARAASQYRLLLSTKPSSDATPTWTAALQAVEASLSAPATGTPTP